ncbi:MAG TPA: sigma-54 dependent transcriptional regulator, partial [Planctomycetota bacterium]|nr:sigma-54 dependent transcriptional regulator [Planctomycetota bacterium]
MPIQHILVVDDDQLSRTFLVEAIQALGYRATAARGGDEGFSLAQSAHPDLVVTDLRMPGTDGLALVKKLHEALPDLPSVLCTAHGTVEVAVQAMKDGASDFLLKPVSHEALSLVIQRIDREQRLQRENRYLRCAQDESQPEIIAESASMGETLRSAKKLARSKGTVLITGESGTGKERIAHLIHRESPRAGGPFIRVNCAALSETLLESELFGHERGAFTGAHKMREGRFELADGGTLLLDELGEVSPALQAKLLRVLEEEEFERVGGSSTLRVDVRVIGTTNRDLANEVKLGKFREDLYYRLHVLPLHIAPLRQRADDVLPLARHFLAHYARLHGMNAPTFTPAAEAQLRRWSWPGNVRELENVVQRAVVLSQGTQVDVADLVFGRPSQPTAMPEPETGTGAPSNLINRRLEDIEREAILATLAGLNGNKTQAAKRLGVSS